MSYRQKHPYIAQLWYIFKYLLTERGRANRRDKT